MIDGALKDDPVFIVQTLVHEIGHAQYEYTPDYSSKAAYVNGRLDDEGAATLKNIHICREIQDHGGPNIGLAGDLANHEGYNQIYDRYLKDGNAHVARRAIGKRFGMGETSSVKVEGRYLNYQEYYEADYEKQFSTTPLH